MSNSPYEINSYDDRHPHGARAVGAGTDPVSITGFVLSFLCCTSPLGLVLGIVGMRRTANGPHRGRWAAIAAIVVGAVGTFAFVGVVGLLTWVRVSTQSIENAEVGQCVNVDDLPGNDGTLFKKDCDEPHEAEVAVAEAFTSTEAAEDLTRDNPELVCLARLPSAYRDAWESGEYELGIVFEADEPQAADPFVCYLKDNEGRDIEAPIFDP